MSVEINVTGEVVTAYLSGELDHHTAKDMRESIDNAIELNMPSLLVLDFSAITFMDSSGIGLIIGRREVAAALGIEVRLKGLSDRLLKLIRLSGLEKISGILVEKR